MIYRTFTRLLFGMWIALAAMLATAGDDRPTKFSNIGGVINTRHNMTQRSMIGGSSAWMDGSRNDYGEVCVYCHTPHGGSSVIRAPLWNREVRATNYTTYNNLGTSSLTQAVSQPGANSLACLSCHDGMTAIDSIINMPGSGRYDPLQATGQSKAIRDEFLNSWGPGGNGVGDPLSHGAMDNNMSEGGCLACHQPGVFRNATDFTVFVMGTDLRDDHPIGVVFPSTSSDFKTTNGNSGSARFFDIDSDSRMDSNEVRLYDDGGGPKVECASCHDPHGVESSDATFIRSFLRVDNTASAVCMSCHIK